MQNHSPQKTANFSNIYYLINRKSVKGTLFYIVLAIKRYASCNVSVKAAFANYFSKLFVDFRKLDFISKTTGAKF